MSTTVLGQRFSSSVARDAASACTLVVLLAAGCTRELTVATDDGLVRARGARARVARTDEGAWSFRYPNGELREEGEFEDGRRTGDWTQYAPNGQLRARGRRAWDATTHSSPRAGEWTFWHENGVVAAHGLYVDGRREGHWEFTNRDGSVDAARSGEYHSGTNLDG